MRNGAFTTVVQKGLPIVAGRNYHVGLQAFGTVVRVLVDGKELIWWEEALPIPHGSAALLGYRTAVEYDNVVAAQVGQRPIFDLFYANCSGWLIQYTRLDDQWHGQLELLGRLPVSASCSSPQPRATRARWSAPPPTTRW